MQREIVLQIQINTDHNIDGREALNRHVESVVAQGLARFRDYVTRIEIHLSDQSAGKPGPADKSCVIEARPEGRPPVAVTHHAQTLHQAVSGAADKLSRLLDSRLGRSAH
jgi:hypothetical protein